MLYPSRLSWKSRWILLIIAALLVVVWSLLLYVENVHAQEWTGGWAVVDPMNLWKLTTYVVDFSATVGTEQLTELNERARIYEEQMTHQIAAVLIPHREWNELFDIGLKVFRETWLWQKDKNNWLLLVIATEEKKIRILVGYGLEWDIPDVLANNIIEESLRPLVNSGLFAEAVHLYYDRVTAAIWTNEGELAQQQETSQDTEDIGTMLAAAAWFILWLIGLRIFGVWFIPAVIGAVLLGLWGIWFGYLLWGIFAFTMKQGGIWPWMMGGFGSGWFGWGWGGFSFWGWGGSSGGWGAGD